MHKIPLALAALLLGLYAPAASSQIVSAEAVTSRQAAADAFLAEHGPHWAVRLSEATGTPLSIFVETPPSGIFKGQTSIAVPGATPEAKALRFFERYATLFGIDTAAGEVLDVTSVRGDDGQTHVRLRQVYGSVPVFTGDYNVTFDERGGLTMVSGRFFPEINLDTTPSLSATGAARTALRAVGRGDLASRLLSGEPLRELVAEPAATLYVLPMETGYALAFEVEIAERHPYQAWRVFVSADDGTTLKVEDVTRRFGGDRAVGHSRVRVEASPVLASLAGTGTGAVFADNGGDASTVTRSLTRLDGAGYTLDGTYVSVNNEDTADAYSSTSQFFYAPSNTHFDEVNVYYHANEFAGALPAKGYAGLGYTIPATVHYGTNYDNAFFDPYDHFLAFGDGDGVIFRDLAKENDVIYHEFAHAVQDQLGMGYNNGETGAIQEGTSDYLAASFAGNPRIGEWVTICTDTGDLRRLNNSKSIFNYGNRFNVAYAQCSQRPSGWLQSPGSYYAVGMIWSGALWDVRALIGQSAADQVVIKALKNLGSFPDLPQGRDAVIQADNQIFGGSNVCDIRQAFADRGLGTACAPPTPDLQAAIVGPDFVTHKNTETWTASYSGGSGNPSFHWYYRTLGSSTWSDTYVTSQTYSRFIGIGHPDFELRVDVTRGSESVTATHSVYYYDGSGGGGGDDCSDDPIPCIAGGKAANLSASEAMPTVFGLRASYPNPTEGPTAVRFSLAEEGHARIVIYDVLGRRVATVVDRAFSAGSHEASFDARALESGVYIYRLTAGSQTATERMIVAH